MMTRCRRLPALLAVLAAALLLPACVEESSTVHTGTDFSSGSGVKPKEPKADDPMPMFGSAVEFLSGDTIRLPGGRLIHLAGVSAPGPGQPYHMECKKILGAIVRRQIFRMVHVKGSTYVDPVWEVNLLVPSLEDVELAEGIVSQKGTNANSVNCVLLANGLVRPRPDLDALHFAPVNEQTGKLEPMSDDRNQRVLDLFKECYEIGKRNSLGIYSGEFAE
ncbi:MAG: hypothetical protein AB7S36_23505 [Planctomycetota bacterium]